MSNDQTSRRLVLQALAAAPLAGAAFPAMAQTALFAPQSVGFSPQGVAALNKGFHDLVDQQKLAGVVTLLSRHGKIVNLDAYGKLNAEKGPSVKTDSIFRIASMTKPTIGVAMMMLWEEGKWKLDDPVAKHIPEFAGLKVKTAAGLEDQKSPMLMKHLMSHTAGFGKSADYTNAKLQETDLQGMINKLARLPLFYHPGKDWQYGPSVDIQGYVVQKLSGMPLDQFMQTRLFTPLGMVDTGFWVDPVKAPRVASVHIYDKAGKITPQSAVNDVRTARPAFISGSGGLLSTVEDYWRFAQMVLNGGQIGGKRYLKADTVKLMRTSVLEPGVNVTLYTPETKGLGFGMDFAIVEDVKANKSPLAKGCFYWGGAFGTWFWIDPVNDVVAVGMIQNLNGSTPGTGTPLGREVMGKLVYQGALPGAKI